MGSISNSDSGRSSYYNVHYFFYPLARLSMILPGATCLRNKQVSVPIVMSEWFPFWNDIDSKWHWVVDPLRFVYQMPELQEHCKKDCEASMKRKPSDQFPWCAGCLGPLYPFCGHVSQHIGGIQASSLLVCRMIGLIHTFGLIPGMKSFGVGMGFNPENYCEKTYSYQLKKTYYKTQLLYPIPDKGQKTKNRTNVYCHPLGESDRDWGGDHIYPKEGEDFVYVVWTKMHCCYDFLDIFKKSLEALKALTPNPEDENLKKTTKEFEEAIKESFALFSEKVE